MRACAALLASVLTLALASIASAGRPVVAAPIAQGVAAPPAPGEAPMTVILVPRSESGVFRGTTLVYLDGAIDAGAPDRLSRALDGAQGTIAVWLNSPGGNLFAGMQLGRIIRAHGAATYIIDSRTLRPGECYSACSLAFLGGVYRFNDNAARYGVHRASLGATTGERDLTHDLSAAILGYIGEMGVDPRLLDLWMKAAADEMYVLSARQAEDLEVVNNGRKPPEWRVAAAPDSRLQGRQATIDGTASVSFSCDGTQTVLATVYETAGRPEAVAAPGERHWLAIDRSEEIPLTAQAVSNNQGVVRATFVLTPEIVRLARSARRIGVRSASLGYSVDVDDTSASMVRSFLGQCLRGQAK